MTLNTSRRFGRLVRTLREEQGYGLRQAAELLGVSAAYLSKIEKGKESPPSAEIIRQMTMILGGRDSLYDFSETNDPELARALRQPAIRELVRSILLANPTADKLARFSERIKEDLTNKSAKPRKERRMSPSQSWPQVYPKMRQNLLALPRCTRHPDYAHVKSLAQSVVNDIISVDDRGIVLRSHRTNVIDQIPVERLEKWWEHLLANGSASLVPGGDNNPDPWRSRIVGAIMATALPDEIDIESNHSISLK